MVCQEIKVILTQNMYFGDEITQNWMVACYTSWPTSLSPKLTSYKKILVILMKPTSYELTSVYFSVEITQSDQDSTDMSKK